MSKNSTPAIILAAGRGSRMQSNIAKVLHILAEKPMILYTLENLQEANFDPIVLVVGYKGEDVRRTVNKFFKSEIIFARQDEALGTGDALKRGLEKLGGVVGAVLAINGDDSAFYKPGTLKSFLASHIKSGAIASFVVVRHSSPGNLGVVRKDKNGNVLKIEDYMGETSASEVNAGAYLFDSRWLAKNIDKIQKNEKGEYYIIELVNSAIAQGEKVDTFRVDPDEWLGINTQEDLRIADQKMKEKLRK
ncbi:MAG: sugar phosphate nucleotidyltransferase [bacterium]|nr:sugar phosphate nucleotidyltransferase [bacterium]